MAQKIVDPDGRIRWLTPKSEAIADMFRPLRIKVEPDVSKCREVFDVTLFGMTFSELREIAEFMHEKGIR